MSSSIPEHENSRFWLFRDKFVIVEAVLNIIVQATAFAGVFFSAWRYKKSKSNRLPQNRIFLNHPTIQHSKMYFVDTFGDFFRTVEWNSLKSVCRISLYILVISPGKSFGLKFIPNQSDLFRNPFPRRSERIRVNPKKVFNLVYCNSVNNQSESIRDSESEWIRTNLSILMNPRSELFGLIRIEYSV